MFSETSTNITKRHILLESDSLDYIYAAIVWVYLQPLLRTDFQSKWIW